MNDIITLKHIAVALGLSVSTVSKALQNSHEISGKTRMLVEDYAKKHNYHPNPFAQSLKKGKSKSIGIVVSTIDNNFFSQVINGIESVAHNKGYNVIITQTHESYEREVKNISHLTSRAVDGLLISLSTETKNTSHLIDLKKKGLPVVFFDRVTGDADTHQVVANNFKGAYHATKHLIDSGYKNIAQITSSANASITLQRLSGYRKALEDHGIQPNNRYIKFCEHGGMILEEIEKAIDGLLNCKPVPDALFAASDRLTTRSLMILHRIGIKIPRQMALLGFTNTVLADVLNPPLTTIQQPAFEMGQAATSILIRVIESKLPVTAFENVMLDTILYIRASTGG